MYGILQKNTHDVLNKKWRNTIRGIPNFKVIKHLALI